MWLNALHPKGGHPVPNLIVPPNASLAELQLPLADPGLMRKSRPFVPRWLCALERRQHRRF